MNESLFDFLVLSLSEAALMAMGFEMGHGQSSYRDIRVARENIEMLEMLEVKTKNNLTTDEKHLLVAVLSDLRLKYLDVQKKM